MAAQTLPIPEAPQKGQITEFITQGKPGPHSGITEAFLRNGIIVEPARPGGELCPQNPAGIAPPDSDSSVPDRICS